MENETMIVNIPSFRRNYFRIGEAIRIKGNNSNEIQDALVVDVQKERVQITVIELDGYEYVPVTKFINLNDVIQGLVEIIKI
jgi:hypothetical protein